MCRDGSLNRRDECVYEVKIRKTLLDAKNMMKARLLFTLSSCTTLGNQHIASACVMSEIHRHKLVSDRTCGMGMFSQAISFSASAGRNDQFLDVHNVAKKKVFS